jgi:hypothetical protein
VEGARRPRDDCIGSARSIRQHAPRRNPDHPVPVFFDELSAALIIGWFVSHVVHLAIDFHDQFCGKTAKVDNVGADRMLAAELEAIRP